MTFSVTDRNRTRNERNKMVWLNAGICILRETDKRTAIYDYENKMLNPGAELSRNEKDEKGILF